VGFCQAIKHLVLVNLGSPLFGIKASVFFKIAACVVAQIGAEISLIAVKLIALSRVDRLLQVVNLGVSRQISGVVIWLSSNKTNSALSLVRVAEIVCKIGFRVPLRQHLLVFPINEPILLNT